MERTSTYRSYIDHIVDSMALHVKHPVFLKSIAASAGPVDEIWASNPIDPRAKTTRTQLEKLSKT